MRYQINFYRTENLNATHFETSAREAVALADRMLFDAPQGACHIFPEGTTEGLYIARPTDASRMSLTERAKLLMAKF